MRRILFILLTMILPAALHAGENNPDSLLRRAASYFKTGRPQDGLALYQQQALAGNARAMNLLGLVYLNGKSGIAKDEKAAISWFEKAAKVGSADALANWGMMIKNGYGTAQDFKQAYLHFEQASKGGSQLGTYMQGFMIYKGLGCKQDYEKACVLFKEASAKGSAGGMYMLGLCYRNGYGITRNIDSARYWLQQSAKKNYVYAREELTIPEAENTQPDNAEAGHTVKVPQEVTKTDITSKAKLKKSDIDGTYSGYIIRYDWSGKHIIGKSKLSLKLALSGKNISGEWLEDDTIATAITAHLSDSGLVFDKTRYKRDEHYNPSGPVEFEFQKARFQMTESEDFLFITGNLQLYSLKAREPEKPMYVTLVRDKTENADQVVAGDFELSTGPQFLAFPNPFSDSFNISFKQEKAGTASLQVFDLGGRPVLSQEWKLEPGKHTKMIDASRLWSASYVVRLKADGKNHTTILIKY